jgi:HEAT repeat protein
VRYPQIELIEPRCPFCHHVFEQPRELKERKLREFPLGFCDHCGAVYAYDATGYNRGAAFLEALLFACNYDEYVAFSLSAGEDFSDAVIENYDPITHKVIPGRTFDDRSIRGALIFVRLNPEYQAFAHEQIKEKLKEKFLPSAAPPKKMRSEKFSRETIQTYISENRFEELIALADEDDRVIPELARMLYTPDEHLRWKIIEILGNASKKVAEMRPDIISKLLNRLLRSAADSASSAWGALEATGAIISKEPELFGEFSQALLSFFQFRNYWKEVEWAVGKIATTKPNLVKYAYRTLSSLLGDSDPSVRGHAVWALGNLGYSDVIDELKKLQTDDQQLLLYREGELKEVTVAQLATEAVEKLSQ